MHAAEHEEPERKAEREIGVIFRLRVKDDLHQRIPDNAACDGAGQQRQKRACEEGWEIHRR